MLTLLLEAAFEQVNVKYNELTEALNESRQKAIHNSEEAFLSLLLGEIDSIEYGKRILEIVAEARSKNRPLRESLSKWSN